MTIIKKWWQRFLKIFISFKPRWSWRRYLIYAGLALFFLFFLYFLVSLWRVSRKEMILAELKKSYELEKICHENCYFWRQSQEKIIVAALKKNEKKLQARVEKYFLNPLVDAEFKKELINIVFLAYGAYNPPDYLIAYLNKNDSQLELIREIVSRFAPGLSGDLSGILENRIILASSSQEKITVLKIIDEMNEGSEIDNYFAFLIAEEDLMLKREIIKNISNIKEKKTYFNLDQLSVIKNIILDEKTNARLRSELVLLLGDYFLIFPMETENLWREIYADKSLDAISRAFSADNLNRLVDAKLESPVISLTEWADYYNQ